MIRKIEIERFSLTTSKAFDEVIAGVNAAIGHPDLAEFGRSTHEARCFAELKSAVEKGLSKAGLMLLMQLDQGAVLQKETGQETPRIIRLLMVSPTAASALRSGRKSCPSCRAGRRYAFSGFLVYCKKVVTESRVLFGLSP